MHLLANENFPLVSVHLLRQAGYEIASITEDSPGIEDPEVLARAVDEQQIILTFDRDYGELVYRFPAIPNSKYFTDSPPIIARFWWGWAGLFDTYWYKSRLTSINLPLRGVRTSLNLELLIVFDYPHQKV
jgi:hypothetical protein